MANESKKKTSTQEAHKHSKPKWLNSLLWVLVVVFVMVAAIGNTYFSMHFSLVVRVLILVALCVGGLAIAALTTQGKKAISFAKESRMELRKIVWPTRSEATQMTLIVIAFAVVVSLALWGMDSVIVSLVTFLTTVRF